MKIVSLIFAVTTIAAVIYYILVFFKMKRRFRQKMQNGDYDHPILDRPDAYSEPLPEDQRPSDEDLRQLESEIGKPLPVFYKYFLRHYPADLVTLGAPHNTVADLHLPNNPHRLIELNAKDGIPDTILVIGEDGHGNFYYVILSEDSGTVYLFSREAPAYLDTDKTMIDWKSSWEEAYASIEELLAHLRTVFAG